MKILFVHDGPMMSNPSKTVFYGVHYTNEIVDRYSYFGDSVTFLMRNIVISEADGGQFTPLTHPAFNFIEVPNFKSIRSILRQKEAKSIIEKAVSEHDVIIARLPSANGVIAKKSAEKLGKPVLVEVVACVFDALWNYDWRGKLLAHYKMFQYKRHIRSASHVIYVTEKFLQERYPTQGKSVGCSDVVLQYLNKEILEKRLRKISNFSGKIVLGTVAAIDVPYKGHADVIKALSRLKKIGNTNFLYKIVGQGNPERLNALIEKLNLIEQVEILGSLPHKKIFDFFDSLDSYIQPSSVEGMPRSVIEAMSMGCPVLATELGGHPELITKEALYKPGDIIKLTELLSDFSNLPLKKWATENFNRSLDFKSDILSQKRMQFYSAFKTFADSNLIAPTQKDET
ncbi:glycosyltransferase family 4 protein [Belliella sp. R4-6]|uniref:Glycosyltransferase family 4 protein n=1 Tax=Belliella alkalica TaxID=1730871 RepID=A0ABS9V6L6_9BACT|nr:glycosyltransferase family 4 protein [Belliella alkalica]MCH7412057.1 glycosyltransferase family 4 protein [Belliella alkalica]